MLFTLYSPFVLFLSPFHLYNKARHSYIFLPMAGQTAGPNGLKSLFRTHGWPGGYYRLKKNFFQNFYFFPHGHRRALQLVCIYNIYILAKRPGVDRWGKKFWKNINIQGVLLILPICCNFVIVWNFFNLLKWSKYERFAL